MECALFLVTTCLVQCKSEDRAVLGSVKWIQEDRVQWGIQDLQKGGAENQFQ